MFRPEPLLLVIALGLALGEWKLAIVPAVLFGDWAILSLAYQITGEAYSVTLMVTVDLVAAELIMLRMTTRWEAALLLTYVVEMVAHASYAFGSHGRHSQYIYWWALNDTAWIQAALCVAWGGLEGGRRIRRCLDDRFRGYRTVLPMVAACRSQDHAEAPSRDDG